MSRVNRQKGMGRRGGAGGTYYYHCGLNRSLLNLAYSEKPKPAKKKEPALRQYRMTDEHVIEARTKHEYESAKPKALAEQYGVDIEYMRSVLKYKVRSKLYPEIR